MGWTAARRNYSWRSSSETCTPTSTGSCRSLTRNSKSSATSCRWRPVSDTSPPPWGTRRWMRCRRRPAGPTIRRAKSLGTWNRSPRRRTLNPRPELPRTAGMRYQIHVGKPAEAQLTRLWTQADSALRRAITQAAHRADQILGSSGAPTAGVSCPKPGLPSTRCLDVGPLVIEYVLMPGFNEVQVRGYYLAPWRP